MSPPLLAVVLSYCRLRCRKPRQSCCFWISPQEIKLRAASFNLSNVRMLLHTEGIQGVEFSTAVWPWVRAIYKVMHPYNKRRQEVWLYQGGWNWLGVKSRVVTNIQKVPAEISQWWDCLQIFYVWMFDRILYWFLFHTTILSASQTTMSCTRTFTFMMIWLCWWCWLW